MIRSATAAMIAAALVAAPAAALAQSPTYPPPRGEPADPRLKNIIRDVLDIAAARAAEERRRERERRREHEQQQPQLEPQFQPAPSPPIAVVTEPEPSSPADPELNPQPVPAKAMVQPVPTKRVTPKPLPAAKVSSPRAKPKQAGTAPQVADPPVAAVPPPNVAEAAPPPAIEPPPAVVGPHPPPTVHKMPRDEPRPSPRSRWWPLALLGFGVAAAGGGWSVQQRRARLAWTRAALSLEPRLDQQAGMSSTTPLKLAAPRISIRTRLEYS